MSLAVPPEWEPPEWKNLPPCEIPEAKLLIEKLARGERPRLMRLNTKDHRDPHLSFLHNAGYIQIVRGACADENHFAHVNPCLWKEFGCEPPKWYGNDVAARRLREPYQTMYQLIRYFFLTFHFPIGVGTLSRVLGRSKQRARDYLLMLDEWGALPRKRSNAIIATSNRPKKSSKRVSEYRPD